MFVQALIVKMGGLAFIDEHLPVCPWGLWAIGEALGRAQHTAADRIGVACVPFEPDAIAAMPDAEVSDVRSRGVPKEIHGLASPAAIQIQWLQCDSSRTRREAVSCRHHPPSPRPQTAGRGIVGARRWSGGAAGRLPCLPLRTTSPTCRDGSACP